MDAIIYCTSLRFSSVQVSGENGGNLFIRKKIIRGNLKRATMLNLLQSAGCTAIILMLQPAGGNVFNNATGSPQTALFLPCYFFAKAFVEILGCYNVFYI